MKYFYNNEETDKESVTSYVNGPSYNLGYIKFYIYENQFCITKYSIEKQSMGGPCFIDWNKEDIEFIIRNCQREKIIDKSIYQKFKNLDLKNKIILIFDSSTRSLNYINTEKPIEQVEYIHEKIKEFAKKQNHDVIIRTSSFIPIKALIRCFKVYKIPQDRIIIINNNKKTTIDGIFKEFRIANKYINNI